METIALAPGLWMLPFPVGHVYALRIDGGFALVDSGQAGSGPALLAALRTLGARDDADLRCILLTHGHADHAGSAAELAAATGARILAHAAEAPVLRGTSPMPPPDLPDRERLLFEEVSAGVPPLPVTPVHATVADGDPLEDWGVAARVLHLPGHTPGSIALHLPGLRAVLTGDTVAEHGGTLLPGVFHADRSAIHGDVRRLAGLGPDIAAFGHGRPLRTGAAAALRELAAG